LASAFAGASGFASDFAELAAAGASELEAVEAAGAALPALAGADAPSSEAIAAALVDNRNTAAARATARRT